MSTLAIVLIVISAFVHAGWNLLSKSRHPSAAFFLVATLCGGVLLSPAVLMWHDEILGAISVRVWWLLIATGFALAVYYIALAGAYRAGDMSIAYPLARASPVIVVLVVTLVLGRAEQVSWMCVAGIVLVVAGCFLIPVKRVSELRYHHYLNATCGCALLAAIGTTGYSILDDEALKLLRTDAHVTLGNTELTLVYACLEAWMACAWLTLFVALRRDGREHLGRVLRHGKRHAAAAGAAIYVTYALVLVSLAYVSNVSYVVGFRQLSIPLGVAFGVLILKEQPHSPKLAGVAVMCAGLLLVALG